MGLFSEVGTDDATDGWSHQSQCVAQTQADEPPQAHLGRDRVKEQRGHAGFSVWVGKQ